MQTTRRSHARSSTGISTGGLTRDRILDNITLYWLTGTATSSARIYWEEGRSTAAAIAAGQNPAKLTLPVAFTVFPGELFQAPRKWAEKGLSQPDLRQRSREGRPLRRLGGAGAVLVRAPRRVQVLR